MYCATIYSDSAYYDRARLDDILIVKAANAVSAKHRVLPRAHLALLWKELATADPYKLAQRLGLAVVLETGRTDINCVF
jgi:hypothetical protein